MKLHKKYLPIWICSILAIGIYIGSLLQFSSYQSNGLSTNSSNKIFQLLDLIDREYVDSVSTDSLLDLTITNMLDKLDPHSVYIPQSEMTAVAQEMRGDFVGIGINFYMMQDSVAVIKTVPNGPSSQAGILAGDRILYADQSKLYGEKLPLDSLFAKLKGEEGSKVALTVYRKSEKKTLKINLERAKIPVNSVDVAVKVNDTTGYIKINRFAETTYNEFHKGLLKLKSQGMKSLVIDVRDNGGGYLDQAIKIADELLSDKKLIVFTKNKSNKLNKTFASKKGDFEKGSVFVLIDENSASASEVLAGAVQDNDRGIIVGRRSFGKGLVQREVQFADQSAVRLTVAKYYTPTGRSIQRAYDHGTDDYYNEFSERFANGELYMKDSIKIADSLQFKTPKGKIVYGGGGIVPDIFVPFETKHGQEGISFLMKSPMVANFVFRELDKNRKYYQNLNAQQLREKVINSQEVFKSFGKFLSSDGMFADIHQLKLDDNKDLIKNYLWAEFTNQLINEIESHKILLRKDPMIQQIL